MAKLLAVMFGMYIVAAKLVKDKSKFGFMSGLSTVALYLLIFTMGLRIGSNEEVTSNMASIGLDAVLITVFTVGGSMLCAGIAAKLMGLNKHGLRKSEAEIFTEDDGEKDNGAMKSSIITLLVAALGVFAGYKLVPLIFSDMEAFQNGAGELITAFLYLLLACVGFDLGTEGGIWEKFKSIGLRVLVLPLAISIGTLGFGALYGLISSMSVKETLAIAAGFGWYSLAPAIIMNAGFISASAVSFFAQYI